MMNLFLSLAMSLASSANACDEHARGVSSIDPMNTYTYDFSFNGCSTGKQIYATLEEMCEGLKSQSRNQSCAERMRENYFKANACPGTWELTP